jgi:hypothetical protein
MHPGRSMTPQLVLGGFIMLIGGLMTLDRLDIINTGRALRFWPLAFIGLGATMLASRREGSGRFWGWAWLFFGSWLLLNSIGVVRVGFWELLFPLLLILLGSSLVMQTVRRRERAAHVSDASDPSNLFAVMSECKRALPGPFRGATMTAIMGGCILDLRQAVMAPGEEAVIDVIAVMAGHELVVPSHWNVVDRLTPIAGAVSDKRLPPVPDPTGATLPAPRVVLKGYCVMGGLTIKS